MGEIDDRGTYINKIPFSDVPTVDGEVVISSNSRRLNNYLEDQLRQLLRDIYYDRVEDFKL